MTGVTLLLRFSTGPYPEETKTETAMQFTLGAFCPAVNLFMDLLTAGLVTDSVNKLWLKRLKEMELEDVFLQVGLSGQNRHHDATNDQRLSLSARANQRLSLSARANQLTRARSQRRDDAESTEIVQQNQSGNQTIINLVAEGGTLPVKLSHNNIRYNLILRGNEFYIQELPGMTVPLGDTTNHAVSHRITAKQPSTAKLDALQTKIRTFQDQAAITICGCCIIRSVTVLTVFVQLSGALIIVIGIFQ